MPSSMVVVFCIDCPDSNYNTCKITCQIKLPWNYGTLHCSRRRVIILDVEKTFLPVFAHIFFGLSGSDTSGDAEHQALCSLVKRMQRTSDRLCALWWNWCQARGLVRETHGRIVEDCEMYPKKEVQNEA